MFQNKTVEKLAFAGFFILLIIITIFSLLPRSLPAIPNKPGIDKVLHFLAYTALGFCLCPAIYLRVKRGRADGESIVIPTVIIVFLFAMAYGGSLELLQRFTGRSPELLDLAADSAGGAAGALLAFFLVRIKRKEPGVNPDQ